MGADEPPPSGGGTSESQRCTLVQVSLSEWWQTQPAGSGEMVGQRTSSWTCRQPPILLGFDVDAGTLKWSV